MPVQNTYNIRLSDIRNVKDLDHAIGQVQSLLNERTTALEQSLPLAPAETIKAAFVWGTNLFLANKIASNLTGLIGNAISLLVKGSRKNEEQHTKEKLKGNAKGLGIYGAIIAGFNLLRTRLKRKQNEQTGTAS